MINVQYHKDLAQGRWFKFSLAQQLGNIGSEVGRARISQGKDEQRFWNAVYRALELFDLTLEDERWRSGRYEIARAREVFCDAVYGGKLYNSNLEDLDKYFMHFALAAQNGK